MKYILKTTIRNYSATSIVVISSMLICIFILFYHNNIQQYQAQLEHLYKTIPVSAHIEGAKPGRNASLSKELHQEVLSSGFVANSVSKAMWLIDSKTCLLGLENAKSDDSLSTLLPDIEWAQNWDENLFQTNALVCIVPSSLGYLLEDHINLLFNKASNLHQYFQIVGIYREPNYGNKPDMIYCPLAALETVCESFNLALKYFSVEFELCNLEQLEDFKVQMLQLGLDRGDNRLIINDYVLQQATKQLKKQIQLLASIFPVLFFLISSISFGISLLLQRKRKQEVAILRSLGLSKHSAFLLFFCEFFMQAIIGITIGCIISLFLFKTNILKPYYAGCLLLSYLSGCALSTWRHVNINTFTILTLKD